MLATTKEFLRVIIPLLLLLGLPRGRAWANLWTVGVDFAALDGETYRQLDGLALEQQVVVRLTQEGFAVVAPQQSPAITVRLYRNDHGIRIEAVRNGEKRTREATLEGGQWAETRLELAQKIVELTRAFVSDTSTSPAVAASVTTIPHGAPLPSSIPADAEPAPPPKASVVEVVGGVDGLLRGSALDGQVRVDGRIVQGRWLAHLVGGWTPSSGQGLAVQEWQILAGTGRRWSLGEKFDVEVAFLGGVMVHHFASDGTLPSNTSGTRSDLLLSLPLEGLYRPARHWGIGVRVAPGMASAPRTHTLGAEVLWTREAFRLEAGVGASVWY